MGRIKHIVILVSNDLTYDQRMHRTANALVEAGYEVTLVGRQKSDSVPLKKEAFQQKRLNCFFEKGKLFYLLLNHRMFYYLLFRRFDVVLAVDADTLLAGTLAAMLRGKKLIYDAHEFFSEVPELQGRNLVKAIWRRVERFGIDRANCCYTVSQGVAKLYEQQYGRKFLVIRNLPPFQQAIPSTQKIPNSIIYQGALNEGRGLEAMIEAMQQIDGTLILAGEGDLSEKLRQLANDFGVANKVDFRGYVTPEALQTLTPQATIGINVLENKGGSYYYSLANKFFAYVQAAIPQVCIDFPEYHQLNEVHEVALLVENTEPKTLQNAMEQLLTDEMRYNRLQENCRKARQKWCWEKEQKKLLYIFSQV